MLQTRNLFNSLLLVLLIYTASSSCSTNFTGQSDLPKINPETLNKTAENPVHNNSLTFGNSTENSVLNPVISGKKASKPTSILIQAISDVRKTTPVPIIIPLISGETTKHPPVVANPNISVPILISVVPGPLGGLNGSVELNLVNDTNTTTASGTKTSLTETKRKPLGMFYQCNPDDQELHCIDQRGVECLPHNSEKGSIFSCQCNYFHTWSTLDDGRKSINICIPNVFSPCSIGGVETPCGPNMVCLLDKLRLNNDKYCRCIPGFTPVKNDYGIPANCEQILTDDEPEEEEIVKGAISDCSSNEISAISLICLLTSLKIISIFSYYY